MRRFIGKQVNFLLEGNSSGPISGKVVGETKDRILVRSKGGRTTRIVKAKVLAFEPEDEPEEWVNLLVLACENTSIGCPGVQYIKEGDGFKASDLEVFMRDCPRKCDSCKRGSKGELRAVSGPFLRQMLAGVIFGEYPKGEEK